MVPVVKSSLVVVDGCWAFFRLIEFQFPFFIRIVADVARCRNCVWLSSTPPTVMYWGSFP